MNLETYQKVHRLLLDKSGADTVDLKFRDNHYHIEFGKHGAPEPFHTARLSVPKEASLLQRMDQAATGARLKLEEK